VLYDSITQKEHINKIIEEGLLHPINKDWVRSVFIEQMLLISKIKQNLKISTVIDASSCDVWWTVPELLKRKNIIHLWTYKDGIHYCLDINNLIKYMTKYYF
jgi:hypothetical protein